MQKIFIFLYFKLVHSVKSKFAENIFFLRLKVDMGGSHEPAGDLHGELFIHLSVAKLKSFVIALTSPTDQARVPPDHVVCFLL